MLVAASQGQRIDDVPSDFDTVIMGIKPSAPKLHMGHWVTMRKTYDLLESQQDARGLVVIDDRQWDKTLESKFAIPKRMQNARRLEGSVQTFFRKTSMAKKTDVAERTRVLAMSEYMRQMGKDGLTNGSGLFELVRSNRAALADIYPDYMNADAPNNFLEIARPICPACNTVAINQRDMVLGTRGAVHAACAHKQCKNFKHAPYTFDPNVKKDADRWGLHYLFAAMRDARVATDMDSGIAHVYGADYHTTKIPGRPTHAERMHTLLERMLPGVPVHCYVGPLVVDEHGTKLSKQYGHNDAMPDVEFMDEITRGNPAKIRMPKPAGA